MARAAVGFAAHLGWAAAVAVVGTRRDVEVALRRKVVLSDPKVSESHEPWHKAAKAGDAAEAREIVRRGTRGVEACARREVAAIVRDLEKLGHRVVGAGILQSGGPAVLEFDSILAAHTLQHTAEGRLMRDALAKAAEKRGLRVLAVKERELLEAAADRLAIREKSLASRIAELGNEIGSPWARDQKNAATIAWMAL